MGYRPGVFGITQVLGRHLFQTKILLAKNHGYCRCLVEISTLQMKQLVHSVAHLNPKCRDSFLNSFKNPLHNK